jgi:6-phosphogluconate dehydrogenase
MFMVRAGPPVDELIAQIIPHLEKGDIIIDGGNSHFPDTNRRVKELEAKGFLFVGTKKKEKNKYSISLFFFLLLVLGTGVSGGEEGALHGPSLMPGGSPAVRHKAKKKKKNNEQIFFSLSDQNRPFCLKKAWPHIKHIFQAICAKTDDGSPCCDWVGEEGAGHFVKMVHNGIEYGDMQLIAEAYHLLKSFVGLTNPELHEVFKVLHFDVK